MISLIYSWPELLRIGAAAVIVDLIVGDPKWPTHPVIRMGQWIKWLEKQLRRGVHADAKPSVLRIRGIILTGATVLLAWLAMTLIVLAADAIHRWLGYAVSVWFVSTTIAVKGLKDAAMLVYRPLSAGNLPEARKYVGYIVSRDTEHIDEPDAARAAVETVAENTVDAFLSPLLFAIIGGAPLAMAYRAANTLDSMVGYKNEKYRYFGWCSARLDDVLNYVPARLSALLMPLSALLLPGMSGRRSIQAVWKFAKKHPSPNSGIPESAAAGALGIELGGINRYFGQDSERARLGWPLRPLAAGDILQTVKLLYITTLLVLIGDIVLWWAVR
ncbi:adenosylcobinamide-phosphate synthase [Paenibacillus cellulosilyticus]|uniref:Cobalamin biosynthesis protein CobD n=1 Tax=Paenibacillus cellulosilyticus TaxID=375489 RepID=A0A2V2YXM8_9BACL|nr:adenosylcobinamide-phosphate synthase CbiB [Paenibacillus cellulosilyticus]PWW06502.1 adenosylcobinamide-phosphate synthase [Paenibacillus cellulosilyticus]QKS46159.1 cobalamin biosynthesis protein CobD [Paenibacillus cellulosilyticus]